MLGRLRYVSAGHVPDPSPYNYHLPVISEFGDVRVLPLHSMRPVPTIDELSAAKDHPQLSTHGFTAIRHPTTLNSAPWTLPSWKDPDLLQRHYIPDTASMLKRLIGCKVVITETIILRSAVWTESDALATHAGHGQDTATATTSDPAPGPSKTQELEPGFPSFIGFNPSSGGVSPAPKAHLDFSPSGARTHIRKYHPDLTAAARDIISVEDALLSQSRSLADNYSTTDGVKRWAMYSIWRPLKEVKRDPLAVLNQQSMEDRDYIPVNIQRPCLGLEGDKTETFDAGGYLARWSERHEWFWIDRQKPEEVLIIGFFDSEMEGKGWKGAGGTLHSSVELAREDGTLVAEGEEARESLELRCLCIW